MARSLDEPRTFGFSAGVVGLAWPRDKNQRESNAESFLIDSGIREASNWRVAQRSSTEGINPLAPGDAENPHRLPRRQITLQPGEETLKMRLVVALVGLAISFALPTFAQKTVDPKIEQQIRALAQKYDAAINNHDPAAVAVLYTEDGVGQIPESKVSPGHGREGIEKAYARWFKGWQVGNYHTTVDRVTAVGNEIRSVGKWSDIFKGTEGGNTSFEGYYSWILVHEGDTWKIRRSTCSGYFTG
jgi:uncharacterized protein (TIGR02246 family)